MQNFLFRHTTNLLQLFQPKLNILMYHRVMPKPDPLRPWEVDKQQFHQHMEWISGVFNVIPLQDALENLIAGKLERRSLSITFDDGYLDNATEALPILNKFGFHATFFCTSAWLNGGLMWNDLVIESIRNWPQDTVSIKELDLQALPVRTNAEKNTAISTILTSLKYKPHIDRQKIAFSLTNQIEQLPDLMMRPEHLHTLHKKGMAIGGHTHSHPIIANLNNKELESELKTNKKILERIIETKVNLFAYPNGLPIKDFRKEQINIIENQGYEAAVTTVIGVSTQKSNIFELPRFTPWDNKKAKFLARNIFTKLH